jgi:Flagellar hook-length control protein FliK
LRGKCRGVPWQKSQHMINLLDLRPQAPSPLNGSPQNAGSDGDAFADLFAEGDKADRPCEDAAPGAWAFPGPAPVPAPKVGQATSGTGMSAIVPASCEGAEVSGLPGQQALSGNLSPELGPVAGEDPGLIAENVSNKAEIVDLAGSERPAANMQKPDGKGFGTPQMPEMNTPIAATGDPATAGQSRMPHNMGPVIAQPDATSPWTGTQVQVTVVQAMVPSVFQQALAQTTVALSGLPKHDPDSGDNDVADTMVTAPRQTVAHDVAGKIAGRTDDGQAEPGLASDGKGSANGEQGELAPTGTLGPHIPTHSTGSIASAAPTTPASVTAAVVAAIPPANTPTDRVEVILSPEELGRVQMDFRADGDGIRVFLTAERPETLDLLRRHADQLASELRQAGYSGASLSFGQWGQPQGEGRHRGHHTTIPQAERHISALSLPPPSKNMSGRGLDLRV